MYYCSAQGVYGYCDWLPKATYSLRKEKQCFLLPIYTVQLITVFFFGIGRIVSHDKLP